MNEWLVCIASLLAALSGLVAGLWGARSFSDRFYAAWMALAAGFGLVGATRALLGQTSAGLSARWLVPQGAFQVRVDALSGLFLLSIFLLGMLGALYAIGYYPVAVHARRAVRLRIYYGFVIAGMALLVVAKNSLLFVVGWELMALSGFMVLSVEDQHASVRESSFVYLVATRIGTLAVIGCFALLFARTGSLTLAPARLAGQGALATPIFLSALLGFGLKAGIMPLHVWLPGAHANAPTHVSAVMSGVLIKMGIYGILRVTSFFDGVPIWWGHLVLALGLISALLGVAFALGQHDIKRLLAYHSVENIGIILLGVGTGLIGRAKGEPSLMMLGFGGALLHVLNHGLFKALLFFGAGAVIQASGTRELERYGGLQRRMPTTALCFLVGSAAIAGLPPLNGFVSELAVYLGLAQGVSPRLGMSGTALIFAVPVLAMVGALALACFVKVYAVTFLGEPRTTSCQVAVEAPWSMRASVVLLAVACAMIGFFPAESFRLLGPAVAVLGDPGAARLPDLTILGRVHLALGVLLAFAYFWAKRGRKREAPVPTWDCGYAATVVRAQYTASSIAADLVGYFAVLLRPTKTRVALGTPWAKASHFSSHVPEVVLDLAVMPALSALGRLVNRLRSAQRGTSNFYVLSVLMTLIVMLAVWR